MKYFYGQNCQDDRPHKIVQKNCVKFLDPGVPTVKISGHFIKENKPMRKAYFKDIIQSNNI